MSLREKIKILVVDDMATSRGLIIQALDTMQIKNYDFCKDGLSAIKHINKKSCAFGDL